MNRLTSRTLKALAPAGSHTAQYVSTSDVPNSGRSSTVRNSGTSTTMPGMNSVASTAAVTTLA